MNKKEFIANIKHITETNKLAHLTLPECARYYETAFFFDEMIYFIKIPDYIIAGQLEYVNNTLTVGKNEASVGYTPYQIRARSWKQNTPNNPDVRISYVDRAIDDYLNYLILKDPSE